MEKHKNLSIFVPHEGCPNRCSFCDQKKISGTQNPPAPRQVSRLCDEFLPRDSRRGKSYEIAFFGGSFTAIDRGYMTALLQAAEPFVKSGRASGIRISTRPDAIDGEILDILRKYRVTSIELGAQSMQDDVLAANLRGHSARRVWRRSKMIKERGFSLGLQMMTGLYRQKDYMEYALDTARQFIEIAPDTVRIYPTITLKDTLLERLYLQGRYIPPTLDQTVDICAVLCDMFEKAGTKIIKLGLHADSNMEKSIVAGPYHQAFKELVESKRFLDRVKKDLSALEKGSYAVFVNPAKHSQATGQKKSNIAALEKCGYKVKIHDDDSVSGNQYKIQKEEEHQCI